MKLSFFELYIAENTILAFSWLKHVVLSFLQKKNVLVCLPYSCVVSRFIALEKGFLTVCSESALFSLDSKQRFCLCLGKLRYSRILLLRKTFSSSFVGKPHIWHSILPKKCFGLLATKLGCFEPYVTENSVSPLLCLKYPAFNFIAGKTCFSLFAVRVGCSQRH